MDWSSIAGLVGKFAPTLGGLLGGAFGPGGAFIGDKVGRVIAAALGVEATPEAVSEALQKDKNAVERLRILEETRGKEIAAQADIEIKRLETNAAQATVINETIRAEAGKVSWWHWRHLLGYVPVILGVEVAALLPLVVLGRITATEASALVGILTPFLAIISGLLGYVASDTTNRINTAITGQHSAGGVMNTIRAALPGGKSK